MRAGHEVRRARLAAGLTQRQLAARTGVPQPAIARIEQGRQEPLASTLVRLLDACGWEVRTGPRRGGGVDRSQIEECVRLTPRQRLERAVGWAAALERVARARRR